MRRWETKPRMVMARPGVAGMRMAGMCMFGISVTTGHVRRMGMQTFMPEHAQRIGSQIGRQYEQRQATSSFGKGHARGPTKDRQFAFTVLVARPIRQFRIGAAPSGFAGEAL